MQEINAKINRFFGIIIVLLIAVTKFNLKMSDLEHKTTTFYVTNTHSSATVRIGNIFKWLIRSLFFISVLFTSQFKDKLCKAQNLQLHGIRTHTAGWWDPMCYRSRHIDDLLWV